MEIKLGELRIRNAGIEDYELVRKDFVDYR